MSTIERILGQARILASESPYDASRYLNSAFVRFQDDRDKAFKLMSGAVDILLDKQASREIENLIREYIRLSNEPIVLDIGKIYLQLEKGEPGLGEKLLTASIKQKANITTDTLIAELGITAKKIVSLARKSGDISCTRRFLCIQILVKLYQGEIVEAFNILQVIRKEGDMNDPLTDLVIQIALDFRAGDKFGIRRAWKTHENFLITDPLISMIVRLFRSKLS